MRARHGLSFRWKSDDFVVLLSCCKQPVILTCWGRAITHICVSKINHHLLQYLNQCWFIVNWVPGNKMQWNLNTNSNFSFRKINLKISTVKWQPFCLGLNVPITYLWDLRCSVAFNWAAIYRDCISDPKGSFKSLHSLFPDQAPAASGSHFSFKTVFPRYGDSHVTDKTVSWQSYLQHVDPYTDKTTVTWSEWYDEVRYQRSSRNRHPGKCPLTCLSMPKTPYSPVPPFTNMV